MPLGPVSFLLLAQVSVGLGVGTVRHSGGSSLSAGTVAPAAQLLRPSFYLAGAGALSRLDGGIWATQGRADLWAALPPLLRHVPLRLAVSAGVAGTTRSDAAASAVGSVLGELVYSTGEAGRLGAGIGGGHVAGALEGEPGIGSLRLRARSWAQPSRLPVQLSLTVEATRFLEAWYTDIVSGAWFENARLTAGAWLTLRSSGVYGSSAAASGSFQYFLTPSAALEVAGGSYLRDPFQALPRAGFVTAGARIHLSPRPGVAGSPARRPPARQALAPLIAQHRGDSVVVQFRMDAQRSLAIAGDWNSWQPVPLRPLGGDLWEAALVLQPGTYHFSLLVDETEWVVPGGVAVVDDGMGGLVALLTVL